VSTCPLLHQQQRTPRQRTGDHLAIESDRSDLAAIAGVNVRPHVTALIPVHVDRDPVKEADPRHGTNLRVRPAGQNASASQFVAEPLGIGG
jgi:hypothetical protein